MPNGGQGVIREVNGQPFRVEKIPRIGDRIERFSELSLKIASKLIGDSKYLVSGYSNSYLHFYYRVKRSSSEFNPEIASDLEGIIHRLDLVGILDTNNDIDDVNSSNSLIQRVRNFLVAKERVDVNLLSDEVIQESIRLLRFLKEFIVPVYVAERLQYSPIVEYFLYSFYVKFTVFEVEDGTKRYMPALCSENLKDRVDGIFTTARDSMSFFADIPTLDGVLEQLRVIRFFLTSARNPGLAIDTLNKFGLLHRDVKPENIFITSTGTYDKRDWELVLGDLGLVCLINTSSYLPRVIYGTLYYTAPEVMDKFPANNALDKSDVFSFGVILAELLFKTNVHDSTPFNTSETDVAPDVIFGRNFAHNLQVYEFDDSGDLILLPQQVSINSMVGFDSKKMVENFMNWYGITDPILASTLIYNILRGIAYFKEERASSCVELIDKILKILPVPSP